MDEIAKLLEQANTPLERSILLMLMEHSRNTRELTVAVKEIASSFSTHRTEFVDHRVEFAAHVKDEGTMLTWGLRIFAITSSLLVFIAGMAGWYVAHHILAVDAAQQMSIDTNSNRLTALETMVRRLHEANGK